MPSWLRRQSCALLMLPLMLPSHPWLAASAEIDISGETNKPSMKNIQRTALRGNRCCCSRQAPHFLRVVVFFFSFMDAAPPTKAFNEKRTVRVPATRLSAILSISEKTSMNSMCREKRTSKACCCSLLKGKTIFLKEEKDGSRKK